MSKIDTNSERSTESREAAVVTTGSFEVRNDPEKDVRVTVAPVPRAEGELVDVRVRSEHLEGRMFLGLDAARELAEGLEEVARKSAERE